MDQNNANDEIDSSQVTDFLYDSNESKGSVWKIYNNINLPQSEVVFFVQMFVIFSLMLHCIIKLAFSSSTCEETSA